MSDDNVHDQCTGVSVLEVVDSGAESRVLTCATKKVILNAILGSDLANNLLLRCKQCHCVLSQTGDGGRQRATSCQGTVCVLFDNGGPVTELSSRRSSGEVEGQE